MSFIDSGAELLDRTESSLNALIADALKAEAHKEVASLAAMAEALAAIGHSRRDGKRLGAPAEVPVGVGAAPAAEAPKTSEPSWMRPKS